MTKLQADLLQKPSVFVGNASHACYAELHNYDYRFELIPNTALVDASEARTAALLRIFGDGRGARSSQLKDSSWLMYADADTYIIDPDRSMESMIKAAHDLQATRMAAAKISVGAGENDGCDLIIQEDGATSDPGANAGWFLLRNSEWSRVLLRRWANTRKARKGDYVQIRQSSGGDDQPALMDLIIHEAGKAGGVAYADTCFKEHLQQLPAWKKDRDWMGMTEPYNKYCMCWAREMEKLNIGYMRGEGVFVPKVCVLPYPRDAKNDQQGQLLSVQARDGLTELEAKSKHRFLVHDKVYSLKIRIQPKWCPRLADGFCNYMWGQWAPEKEWLQPHLQKEAMVSIEKARCPKEVGNAIKSNGTAIKAAWKRLVGVLKGIGAPPTEKPRRGR
jgi:hypothetical protein